MFARMGRIFSRMGIVGLSHVQAAPGGGGGGSHPTYFILGF
jgi:hypothetical protein